LRVAVRESEEKVWPSTSGGDDWWTITSALSWSAIT
jgi:hypothetical protein